MKKSDRIKQNEFMKAYEPIHARFELFCQARSSFIMDQEDLMNESITRAYNSWDKIKDQDALLYFLFGVVKNIILNAVRKKREVNIEEVEVEKRLANNQVELDIEISFLYQQINKLSDEKKEVIILFEISGFSIKEIAKIQDTSVGAVNMRLSRARKELKKLIRDDKKLPIKSLNDEK